MIKNSIVKRWAFSVLFGIIVLIISLGVFIGYEFKIQYYNTVRTTLNSRANSTVLYNFSSSVPLSDEVYNQMSRRFIDNFADKNLMEVWVIDRHGKVVASSTGFSVDGEKYPDYNYAKENENGKAEWIGTMKNGEKVMALSYVIPDNGRGMDIAVRFIVSLEEIDRQLGFVWFFLTIIVIVLIFFVVTSGAFFIRSIINPVKRLNETASKIAKGNFNVSIEPHKYNDEIGQLCTTINNMAYEIGETERMKNEFISTVSHELRTPLTAIKGWAETIKNGKDSEELLDKGIDVIINETGRLSEIVEDLLDFSRMESGKMSLKLGIVDIYNELNQVLEAFSDRASRENIRLITDISSTTVKFNGDKNRLKQVFVNVIDNSFKYNHSGGFVRVSLKIENNSVVIIIEDNGCGISKNDLPKIREKFYKANNSVRGSGIGLAVADEIIKLHGGEMIIESEIGKGTKTIIIIPRDNKVRRK